MKDFTDSLQAKNLKKYLQQISKFPQLTQEEEHQLGKKIQQGDEDAMRRLIESNLRFVVAYVKRYRGMGLGLLDLIHEGNLGLIEAAKRFDPDRNVKFISYAVWWIRQAIIHALTLYSRIYNIPQKLSDQISEMNRVRSRMKKEMNRDPTREEVADEMSLSIDAIEELELLEGKDISLSEKYYDGDVEMGDKITDNLSPSVEQQIISESIHRQIRDILKKLDEKEVIVLKLRFGLDDERSHTLQEIGDKLDLTRERIRQIEKKAMRKLSQSQKLQQLRGYLN
ncbi:MAG: RNA polymerase sigma factor RpoD/SigA [Candidatus Aminicenantes bacterium]|nr:RNA polymerase sigma factor RpoD/SigA [Candidatus Aminicenantes bacterium]